MQEVEKSMIVKTAVRKYQGTDGKVFLESGLDIAYIEKTKMWKKNSEVLFHKIKLKPEAAA